MNMHLYPNYDKNIENPIVLNINSHTATTKTQPHIAILLALSSATGGAAREVINTSYCVTASPSRKKVSRSHDGLTKVVKAFCSIEAKARKRKNPHSRDGVAP